MSVDYSRLSANFSSMKCVILAVTWMKYPQVIGLYRAITFYYKHLNESSTLFDIKDVRQLVLCTKSAPLNYMAILVALLINH